MKRHGIDVDMHERSGALNVISYTDIYIRNGIFSIQEVMDAWNTYYEDALKNGFRGLRITGEMSCFLKHHLEKELMQYEQALHRVLDVPMVAICAYDANALANIKDPINVYSELVKVHGTVLFTTKNNEMGKIEIRKA